MKLRNRQFPNREQGFALFIGLVFLLMITLVAVTAMRGTSLELSMATNTANHEEAFEGAESGRMSFVRVIRDHVACNFRFGQDAQLISGGSASSIQGREGLENSPDYHWEPRLKLHNANWGLDVRLPGETGSDPKSYRDRFQLRFGTTDDGVAEVGTFMVGTTHGTGAGAAMLQGYDGPGAGAKGGSARYIEVTSRAELANARANVAGHYRLLSRDAAPDTCASDLVYGS